MGTYIAVCDDNMADRKQMERLLGRESDIRLNDTGVLYIDSYGSEDALLKTPMKYDMFFIDLTEGTRDGMDVATTLRSDGVLCPIVLCSSKINYPEKYGNTSGYLYMNKPILKQELSDMIDYAIEEKKKRAPLIELRDDYTKTTYFVTADEIIYLKEESHQVHAIMTNGRSALFYGTLDIPRTFLRPYPFFLSLGFHILLNMNYIKRRSGRSFEMINGERLPFSIFEQKRILNAYIDYKKDEVS